MATEGISEHHQNEIKRYLQFFRTKMERHLHGIEADFDDTLSDRLSAEDMYTQQEVTQVVKSLASAVKSQVRSEYQACINMSALLIRQMFRTADEEEVELELDTSVVEDRGKEREITGKKGVLGKPLFGLHTELTQKALVKQMSEWGPFVALLEKVQKLRVDEASLAAEKKETRKKLSSMKGQHKEMTMELENTKKTNEQLNQRFQQVQEQCSTALKDKQKLRTELEEAQSEIKKLKKSLQSSASSNSSSMRSESREKSGLDDDDEATNNGEAGDEGKRGDDGGATKDLKKRIRVLEKELKEAKDVLSEQEELLKESQEHMSQSKQFQQMKKLLATKNDEIRELRSQLGKSENDCDHGGMDTSDDEDA